eukprot:324327-Rhodomonas_salina.1
MSWNHPAHRKGVVQACSMTGPTIEQTYFPYISQAPAPHEVSLAEFAFEMEDETSDAGSFVPSWECDDDCFSSHRLSIGEEPSPCEDQAAEVCEGSWGNSYRTAFKGMS